MKKWLCLCVGLWGTLVWCDAGTYELRATPHGPLHCYWAKPAELSLHWKGSGEGPLRTFEAVEADLLRRGKRPVFLMNAGIFEPGGIPSGLHVEGGKEVLPLTLAEGKGNFFLKPNGVFFVEGERARVMRSEAYALSKATPRFALQSGPLLLFQGKIHPQFRKKSESKLHRNGVGILPDGRVLFLMTDLRKTRVNLYTFAQLFRSFGCQEALFLDGDLSRMWVDPESQAPGTIPEEGSRELAPGVPAGNHFGAVLAATVSAE